MKRIFLSLIIAFYFVAGISAQEYGFDVWTTANGLPQNTVTGVTQTPDGYLWFSTFDGLARFDGVRFTIFDKGNTKGIVNNRFSGIFVDRQGTIYAAAENNVVTVYRNGVFTSHAELTKEATAYIFIKGDADGNAIIETDTAEYSLQNDRFGLIPNQKAKGLKQTFIGKSGAKWVFEPHQISRIKAGQTTVYQITLTPLEMGSSISLRPFEDSGGALWLFLHTVPRLIRLQNGAISKFTPKDIPDWNGLAPSVVKEETDGSLWFFFSIGLPAKPAQFVRLKDGQWTTYQLRESIDSTGGLIDREGNFWLATTGGLQRLRRQLITNLSSKDGLNDNEVYPIVETTQGDIFIGSTKGLNRYRDGKITDLGVDLLPGRPILASGLSAAFGNELWLGYGGGFGRYENSKLKKLRDVRTSATDFNTDREGNVWISTGEGLYKYQGENEIGHYTTDDGLPDINAVLTHQDRNGNLWAGTFDGIAVLKGNRFADFKQEPDSPQGYVRAIYEDADGTLWFGTYGDGLFRYKDGKFFNYRVEHGLFNNGVFAILEDRSGNLWMSSNRGIHRVNKRELSDFADGKIPKLNAVSYDEKDGMLNAECNGGRIPAAIKTKDGKLWFATMGGVAIVDPEAETTNQNLPPTIFEDVLIDRKPVEKLQSEIELKPNQSTLEIHYTGLSLIKSHQIKFRYRLEGLEENWIEAGTQRTANYSYLPAGNYTFRVVAANANGVWNTEGASIKIVVHPYFYQTWWFRILASLAAALIIGWIYHNRISQLRKIAETKTLFSRQLIESQEAERKRIAAELHDGLGQSLLVIKTRTTLGKKVSPHNEKMLGQFEEISKATGQALDEVRSIAYNLRPYHLERLGLRESIEAMIEKIREVTNLEIKAQVSLYDEVFSKDDEVTFYRVIQECLNNIIKHSQATAAEISIIQNEKEVIARVEDNGRGFTVVTENQAKGFGLIGMSERIRMLGGTHAIESEAGKGTKVTVIIPRQEEKIGQN